MDSHLVCKSCQNPVSSTYFFCPYCGKKLKQPPLHTSITKFAGMILLALFFPLLALGPGIVYLRQADNASKVIGVITLLVSGIAFLASMYIGVVFYRQFDALLTSNPLGVDTSGIKSLPGLER